MPWPRNAPDPLETRRRQLAEQERLLAEQRKRLTEEIQASDALSAAARHVEPPVWRMEEDGHPPRVPELASARKRNLARQRQRDMVLFFLCIGVLLIVVGIVLWVWYAHNASPVGGA